VKEESQQIKDEFDHVVGSALVPLSNQCGQRECNIGNVFADAFVFSYIESMRRQRLGWTSATVAVLNGGSIRNSITVGNITLEEIVSVSPFGNMVGVLKANGSLLWQILEHSGSNFGGFLQVSGLRIEYDSRQPIGRRLQKVRVRCGDCLIPQFEDIDLSKTYGIVITDYIANGGSNYSMIDPKDFSIGSETDYEVFANYVKSYSPIYTGIEDRILFISASGTSTTTIHTEGSTETPNTTIPNDETTNRTIPNDETTNTTIPNDETTNTTIPNDETTNTTIPNDETTNTTIPNDETTNANSPNFALSTQIHSSFIIISFIVLSLYMT
jgi:5'-nucleotidase